MIFFSIYVPITYSIDVIVLFCLYRINVSIDNNLPSTTRCSQIRSILIMHVRIQFAVITYNVCVKSQNDPKAFMLLEQPSVSYKQKLEIMLLNILRS